MCGHVPAHHDKRKSIPQGLMADYKVIFGCGWTGCGCPRYVEAPVENDPYAPTTDSDNPQGESA